MPPVLSQVISKMAQSMDKRLKGSERLLVLDEVGQPKKEIKMCEWEGNVVAIAEK